MTEPKQSGGEIAWLDDGTCKNKIHAISVGVCSQEMVEFYFYRATACDRAKAERRRGCMTCSFPEEVHNPRRSPAKSMASHTPCNAFPSFSPKRCLFRSFHASYLPYFVK